SYYDSVELALYNTVLAGINIEGDRYFYVNPLEVVPEFCTAHTYMNHVKPIRQKWFSIACCPPNVARTLASLGQYIYARDGEELVIHQFISSEVRTEVGGHDVELRMDSTLMQDGKVKISIRSEADTKLKIRIPGYAGNWTIRAGEADLDPVVEKGYLKVTAKAGEQTLVLDLDIHPHWVAANDLVRADAGKAALMKGPFVYCLEEKDNGNLLSQVCVEANQKIQEAAPAEGLVGEIPTLSYPGVRVKNAGLGDNLYGALRIEKEETQLTAIPYCLWNNRGEGEMLVWHRVLI
ncbi:MAG: glycoside hydrolase family 127 protein, partial [Lachnospiraceae bacterium]|nr:glycoside hydrolase family 127 protein [Lachnospiraceae bacterium]